MKYAALLLVLAFVLALSLPQPSAAHPFVPAEVEDVQMFDAAADATLRRDVPGLTGDDRYLNIEYWSKTQYIYYRWALVAFDLSSLPDNAVIDSAVMTVYWQSCQTWEPGTGGAAVSANMVTSPWQEETVTWNTRPTFKAEGVVRQIPCEDPLPANPTWDITVLAKQWHADPNLNFGVLLNAPETGQYSLAFHAREEPPAPQLEVRYHYAEPVTPTPTASLTSTPTTTNIATPTPTESATPTVTGSPSATPTGTLTPATARHRIFLPVIQVR